VGNALNSLLEERHLHAYSDFVAEYERRAQELDLPRQASPPTKAQYYRWLAGNLQNLPRGYHCAVLERMFPGWTATALFAPNQHQYRHPTGNHHGLLSSFPPAVDPADLAGLWFTWYRFDGTQNHIELSTITVTSDGLEARNYPPEPRTDLNAPGFRNLVAAGVFGRHVIGQWRKTHDNYYYGSLHLVVLPGEALLDGYYTGFLTDTQVVAEPWRWIRVEPESAAGIDLNTVTLRDPGRLCDVIANRTRYDGPIPLAHVIEDR
jgi:hypothetical protein